MAENSGEVTLNVDKIRRRFESLHRTLTSEVILNKIGNFLVAANKARTLASKDVNGRFFKPYSDKYRFWRRKHGYGTTPDLYLSGSMLGSMTYNVEKEKIRVFFMPGQDKTGTSNPAKAFWLQEDRRFFGIAKRERDYVIEMYRNYVREEGLSG
jgi:hypothetical protein